MVAGIYNKIFPFERFSYFTSHFVYSVVFCHLFVSLPLVRFRLLCQSIIAHKLFDYVVLVFIFLNCITVALERPKILQGSLVRKIIFYKICHFVDSQPSLATSAGHTHIIFTFASDSYLLWQLWLFTQRLSVLKQSAEFCNTLCVKYKL